MKVRTRSPFWRRVARGVGRRLFRWAENNDDTCVLSNGELWLVRELMMAHVQAGEARPFVVFDVGANRGEYTQMILGAARELGCVVDLHAFEPSPTCAAELRAQFEATRNVRIVAAALGAETRDAVLHGGRSGSSQASLTERAILGGDRAEDIVVPVKRLADYLDTQGIGRVDLLKLDVEGAELAVLQGADERLSPALINVVQFEYGGTTLDAGASLRKIYALLMERGYAVGKLFPAAVELRVYSEWMEHFSYANYVAVAPQWQRGRDERS